MPVIRASKLNSDPACSCPDPTWTINEPRTTSKIGLNVIQSHPLCRMHSGQYQAGLISCAGSCYPSNQFLWYLKSIYQITHPLYANISCVCPHIIAIIVCAELASAAIHQVLFYCSYHSICYFTHTCSITLLVHMPHSLSVQSCGSVQLAHMPRSPLVQFCGSVPPPCPLDDVLVCLVLA